MLAPWYLRFICLIYLEINNECTYMSARDTSNSVRDDGPLRTCCCWSAMPIALARSRLRKVNHVRPPKKFWNTSNGFG